MLKAAEEGWLEIQVRALGFEGSGAGVFSLFVAEGTVYMVHQCVCCMLSLSSFTSRSFPKVSCVSSLKPKRSMVHCLLHSRDTRARLWTRAVVVALRWFPHQRRSM